MAKGDGLAISIVGTVALIAALFFDFYDTGSVSFNALDSLKYAFTEYSSYFDFLSNIGTIFQTSILSGLIVLFPIIYLVGMIVILISLNGNGNFGAILIFIFVIGVFVLMIVDGIAFADIFSILKAGFYLMLVGPLFVIIGSSKNKSDY